MALRKSILLALFASAVASASARPAAAFLSADSAVSKLDVGHSSVVKAKLDPFATQAEACDYCLSSYSKVGTPPAGPVDEECTCMAYPDGSGYNMFCATPTSAATFIKEQSGCVCKPRDMENMGQTTCTPL